MAAEVGVTERGTTGAGKPQIAGVPQVHRFRELDGRGTTGDDIRQGRPLKPPAMIHGCMVANGTKLVPHWTKSWLVWRLACWTPAKAKPKNRSMSCSGESRRDQMSLRQQLRRKESMNTSHREMLCIRRLLELVLAKGSKTARSVLCPSGGALEANEVSDVGLETEYTRWQF